MILPKGYLQCRPSQLTAKTARIRRMQHYAVHTTKILHGAPMEICFFSIVHNT